VQGRNVQTVRFDHAGHGGDDSRHAKVFDELLEGGARVHFGPHEA